MNTIRSGLLCLLLVIPVGGMAQQPGEPQLKNPACAQYVERVRNYNREAAASNNLPCNKNPLCLLDLMRLKSCGIDADAINAGGPIKFLDPAASKQAKPKTEPQRSEPRPLPDSPQLSGNAAGCLRIVGSFLSNTCGRDVRILSFLKDRCSWTNAGARRGILNTLQLDESQTHFTPEGSPAKRRYRVCFSDQADCRCEGQPIAAPTARAPADARPLPDSPELSGAARHCLLVGDQGDSLFNSCDRAVGILTHRNHSCSIEVFRPYDRLGNRLYLKKETGYDIGARYRICFIEEASCAC